MKITLLAKAPVVSILSSSPAFSRRSQDVFRAFFALDPISLPEIGGNDDLNSLFTSIIPGLSKEWDSVASKCRHSGTVLHFLSIKSPKQASKDETLCLLSITDDPSATNDHESVLGARAQLALHMSKAFLGKITKLWLSHTFGRPTTVVDVLSFGGGLPLLQLGQHPEISSSEPSNTRQVNKGLRELSVPVYEDARYLDGCTLLSYLSASDLCRPTIGVYQFTNSGLALRPLPAAKEDMLLPAPSLVFYTPNLEEAKEMLRRNGVLTAKIGYRGSTHHGQLMVIHKDTAGLDIRLTESTACISSFSEAQEALLAGSLDELQNVNVLMEGGNETKAYQETMNGLGDCWVEFRANLKKPSGFFTRNTKSNRQSHKVAKAPDIPYE